MKVAEILELLDTDPRAALRLVEDELAKEPSDVVGRAWLCYYGAKAARLTNASGHRGLRMSLLRRALRLTHRVLPLQLILSIYVELSGLQSETWDAHGAVRTQSAVLRLARRHSNALPPDLVTKTLFNSAWTLWQAGLLAEALPSALAAEEWCSRIPDEALRDSLMWRVLWNASGIYVELRSDPANLVCARTYLERSVPYLETHVPEIAPAFISIRKAEIALAESNLPMATDMLDLARTAASVSWPESRQFNLDIELVAVELAIRSGHPDAQQQWVCLRDRIVDAEYWHGYDLLQVLKQRGEGDARCARCC